MTVSYRKIIFFIVLLLAQAMSACASQSPVTQPLATQTSRAPTAEPIVVTFPEVTLPGTEVRQLKSSTTGRDYDIYIRFPEEYAQDQAKKYPVLYVLDGQWDFKLLDSIYGGLHYDGFVPAMIIVGITYSGDHPDYNTLRAMDYTPFHEVFIQGSGDAPKFHTFLKEQLIPFIETNYRADPSQRMLMGSSFGGTFTLYAMFTEPDLFNGYVASSPAVTFGSRFAFQQEAEYASSHTDLPVRLYLTVGEVEDLRWPVQEFMRILSERNYPGLEMETRTLEDEGHSSNKPESYNRGLQFIFQDE